MINFKGTTLPFFATVLLSLLGLAAGAHAAPRTGVTLDRGFGGSGVVVGSYGHAEASSVGIAVAPDGSTVTAGNVCSLPPVAGRTCDLALIAYSRGGAETRRTPTGFAPSPDLFANDVVVDSAGRTTIVGRYYSLGFSPAVARYNSDGTLDPAFSTAKVLAGKFSPGSIDAVAVDSMDRVVLAGTGAAGAQIARLNPDGNPDASFGGGDGVAEVEGVSSIDAVSSLVVGPDDEIVFALSVDAEEYSVSALRSLTPTGSPGPHLTKPPGFLGRGVVTDLAIDSQRRVVASLAAQNGLQVARIVPDGSLDRSFGRAGVATIRLGRMDSDSATTVAVDRRNRPLVSGYRSHLARFTVNGKPDRRFGPRSYVATPFGRASGETDIEIDPGGRILIGGWRRLARSGSQGRPGDRAEIVLARYRERPLRRPSRGR